MHIYEFLICNVFVIMIYADYYLYIDCIIIQPLCIIINTKFTLYSGKAT